ncbi:MAG: MarR family winged helix-turn-helix transcriptional regulator [Labrys sp. (in: a-proteobacteria)]|jgi:MarR family transcriptional repressor of emrRAB
MAVEDRNAHAANLLGALGLGISDLLLRAAGASSGHGGETGAAIVSIGSAEGLSVGQLARVLALSHAGAVRLVDRLEADGFVSRRPGSDARQRIVTLTAEGVACRAEILAARSSALAPLIDRLVPADREALDRITATLLQGMATSDERADEICRLCDERTCLALGCPIETCPHP